MLFSESPQFDHSHVLHFIYIYNKMDKVFHEGGPLTNKA